MGSLCGGLYVGYFEYVYRPRFERALVTANKTPPFEYGW